MQEQLKGQLEAMRAELTQLEADLSSRDDEAAKLSRTLADARAKLGGSGGPDAPAPLSHVPGSIRVKLGEARHTMSEGCLQAVLRHRGLFEAGHRVDFILPLCLSLPRGQKNFFLLPEQYNFGGHVTWVWHGRHGLGAVGWRWPRATWSPKRQDRVAIPFGQASDLAADACQQQQEQSGRRQQALL